ncbi:hypothetical protein [Sphingobium yanoikuyae]|uniref:hypothetical protein n=1 Tax=Sphingobium yanoikuyae TaxID=13690 RepID=UPI0028AB8DD7|nr:hypothetical protein [Sphingobium yanoikuyae]
MSGYRNPYEARCARDLGAGWEYEAIKLPYTIEHVYVPDFIDRAAKRIVEAKGRYPASDRKKMLAVKAANPDWTYEIWFMNPEAPINKGSKTTNRAWAEKHGFVAKQGPKR